MLSRIWRGVSGIGSYDVHDRHSPIDAARRERWLELWVGEMNAAIDGAVSAGATEVVVIVGQHAMAGDRRGHLRHTYSRRRLAWVRLNGNEIGEAGLIAGIAGDDAAVAEFSRMAPNAEGVAVKNSLSGTQRQRPDLYLQGEHLSPLWDRFIGLRG
jgi:D-aminopeptidase